MRLLTQTASEKMLLLDSRRAVRRVAIVGGTHGNEATGVAVARYLARHPTAARRPSFETMTILANTAAIAANTRYVDEDLNRCFLSELLGDASRASGEAARARELDLLIGPKGSEQAHDLVIDLHNTTSNSGIALMMAPDDALSHAVAAKLVSLDSRVRVCEWAEASDHAMLPSVGASGFTLEVGPVAWGVVDGELYATTLRLVLAALDAVHERNAALAAASPRFDRTELPVFRTLRRVDYPRDECGELQALVHPKLQSRDFEPLVAGTPIFLDVDGTSVAARYEPEPDDGEVVPFFINEAAYYEKGIAFALAKRATRTCDVW